ncbi:FIST C-terminal domain-containing protein [Vibrio makurazakiensis]|uniref:FIST signal transduction protein n=1 Tax=Vibrio makurazakiensis TaxID=2910250 RepID=UPI003D0F8CAB
MKFRSLTSTELDEVSVIREFSDELSTKKLAHLICYYTEDYQSSILQEQLLASFPGISLHGCSTCHGVMTERGFKEGPVVGVLAIYDLGSNAFGTGITSLEQSTSDAVTKSIDLALKNAGREGEVPDLLLIHSTPGKEEQILTSIDRKFGTKVPIIGGSAADNKVTNSWSVFTEGGISSNALSITAFFSSQSIFTSLSSGHAPTEYFGTATKVEGRVLLEINGEPAKNTYHEWTNQHTSDSGDSFLFERSNIYPIGRHVGTELNKPYFKLSHPIRETDGGGIELFTDILEGDLLYLMSGCKEKLVSRSADIIKNSYYSGVEVESKLGAINIFCAGPMLYLKHDMQEVCNQINQSLDGQPFICPFTFGEQGRLAGGESSHGNLMVSSATFYRLKT